MTGKLPVFGALGAALLLTAGCTTRVLDVFEEPNDTIIVGAKSRHITALDVDPRSPLGHVRPRKVICAEPSPDTVSAVAQSLTAAFQAAAQVQAPQGQGQGQGALAAQFGKSVSEGLIQMTERTQTIQLLRDSLYRACEAYANGALSDTTYALLLSRYDDTMVTMLSSELVAGAFGRTPGAISSEAQHSLKDLSNDLKTAQEQFQKTTGGPPPTAGGSGLAGAQPSPGPQPAQGAGQQVTVQQLPGLPASQSQAPQTGQAPPAAGVQQGPAVAASQAQAAPAQQPATTQAPLAGQQPAATTAQQQASAPSAQPAIAPSSVDAERRAAASGQIAQAAGALMGGARVVATAGGGLNPQPTPQLADKLIQLHDRFSEGGAREAYLVACLNALDRREVEGKTGLAKRCDEFLGVVTQVAIQQQQVKKDIDGSVDLARDRARYDYQLRYAQIRAGVLTDMVKFCSGVGQASANSAQCNELLKSVRDIFNIEFAAVDSRLKQ